MSTTSKFVKSEGYLIGPEAKWNLWAPHTSQEVPPT